jgi:thiosulfate dehydrogenase
MIKGLVMGILLTVIVVAGGVYFYFATGIAPAATADPPMPFEKKLANMALKAHIANQPLGPIPVAPDDNSYLAGAEVYKQHCASCHGLPGQLPTDYSTTMYPKAPQLFHGKGVTDDPVTESYWKIANGIRLTGMPAFKTKLTDTQLWQVSQLLAHANEVSDSVKRVLVTDAITPALSLGPAPSSKDK